MVNLVSLFAIRQAADRAACRDVCPLVLFLAGFLSVALAGQRLLYTLFFARFQVVRVTLHLFDDVLLLHLALEAA